MFNEIFMGVVCLSKVRKTNKKYKNSVFVTLFSKTDRLLELYNAISGKDYGKDTEIKITTLDDVLYMERVNDISFEIDGKIVVLIEHQSTINENMPLRMLFYISRIYEKLVKEREVNLYLKGRIPIPSVEFFVLYNGVEKIPDKQVLKLSDAFIRDGEKKLIMLELEVKVLNINRGCNPELTARSATLNEYEIFIDLVHRYEKKTGGLVKAIEMAIDECIRVNVLKDFLEEHSSEVRNMLNQEWDWNKALEVSKMEGREEGLEEGIEEGKKKITKEVLTLIDRGASMDEVRKKLLSIKRTPLKSKKRTFRKR